VRFIIYSQTFGTYLAASTFTNKATTWASRSEAAAHAAQFDAEDDPKGLEILPVDTNAEFATMEECVAAGAAPWEHHIKRLACDPECYSKVLSKDLLRGLGDDGLVLGGPARAGMGAWFVLPHLAAVTKAVCIGADPHYSLSLLRGESQ
jgi:hypothetical protein